jgi:hypothetical protein
MTWHNDQIDLKASSKRYQCCYTFRGPTSFDLFFKSAAATGQVSNTRLQNVHHKTHITFDLLITTFTTLIT